MANNSNLKSDPQRALIVVADDGQIYKVEEADYKKHQLPDAESGVVRQLVKWGASFGFMPTTGPGIGSACYLVNLRSLRTRAPELPAIIDESPKGSTPSGSTGG
jgi:hypothetical protein